MRQLVLTALKKLKNIEVFVNLFEEWLGEKCKISRITKHYLTQIITPISVRSINATVIVCSIDLILDWMDLVSKITAMKIESWFNESKHPQLLLQRLKKRKEG